MKATYDPKTKQLVLTIDCTGKGLSKSGKAVVLATSHGFDYQTVPGLGFSYNVIKRPD